MRILWRNSTKDADFPCAAKGLLYCDTKAAQYPKIVDYYIRDGKERLQAAMNNLTAIIARRGERQPDEPLIPADVMSDLAAIYKALNDCDPFYRYDFAVSDSPPPGDPSGEPGLVGVHAVRVDSVWIAVKIFALSSASLQERPIGGEFQIVVPADDDELRRQFEKHINYGAPVRMPPGTVTGTLDFPGGLGGPFQHGSLEILEVPETDEDDPPELLLAIVESDSDAVIACTTIRRTAVTAGQAGLRSVFVDHANLFRLEILTDQPGLGGTMKLTIDYDLGGRKPAEIVDSLKVLAAWRSPNRLALALPFGPRDFGVVANIDTDRDGDSAKFALVAEALTQIQHHVPILLKMPSEMSGKEALIILEAAQLLAGESVKGTISGAFTVYHRAEEPEIARDPDRLYEFMAIKEIEIPLSRDTVPVGKQAIFFRGRYLDITQDHSTIEPRGESVSFPYNGELEVTRVMARPVPGDPLDAVTAPG